LSDNSRQTAHNFKAAVKSVSHHHRLDIRLEVIVSDTEFLPAQMIVTSKRKAQMKALQTQRGCLSGNGERTTFADVIPFVSFKTTENRTRHE